MYHGVGGFTDRHRGKRDGVPAEQMERRKHLWDWKRQRGRVRKMKRSEDPGRMRRSTPAFVFASLSASHHHLIEPNPDASNPPGTNYISKCLVFIQKHLGGSQWALHYASKLLFVLAWVVDFPNARNTWVFMYFVQWRLEEINCLCWGSACCLQ